MAIRFCWPSIRDGRSLGQFTDWPVYSVAGSHALFTVSFQLSFLATWGLVCLYPSLKEYLRYQQRIWDLVLIPFCAQLAVVPVIAYYFNLFTPSEYFTILS